MRLKSSRFFCCLAIVLLTAPIFSGCDRRAKPSTPQNLLEWNRSTLIDPYTKAGHTNAAWDAPAERALEGFAQMRAGKLHVIVAKEIVETNVAAALEAGCDDPMIQYLKLRFGTEPVNAQQTAEDYTRVARLLSQSSYPNLRIFYGAYWALEKELNAYKRTITNHSESGQMKDLLYSKIRSVLADKTTPAKEAYEAADTMLTLMNRFKLEYEEAYAAIEGPLTANWPEASTTWLLIGDAKIKLAWKARGNGYANTVSDEGWKVFKARLKESQKALEKACELDPKDPRPCISMITACMGLNQGEDEMNKWFDRAMTADPDCYDACQKKLYFLTPRWGGSREQMLAFGKECVGNTNWGGMVPLVLADAHYQYWSGLEASKERDGYWLQPEVWEDIQASFDRYLANNPDDPLYYKKYAWYAYYGGHWAKLKELVPKMGDPDPDYFGGKEAYDEMILGAKTYKKEK